MFINAIAYDNGGVALDWDDGFGVGAHLSKCFF